MDNVVLVPGGAGTLGRVVTRAFLEQGARVAVPFYKTDIPGALDSVRAQFGDHLHRFALDLTTERGAEAAVREVVEWGGRLDSVVHLVGGYGGGSRIAETPLEVWDRMMELNLKSARLIARTAIPRMLEVGGGTLTFISSRAALERRKGRAAYAVAKAALLTLVSAIAEEYRHDGIRANAVLPGRIDTEANRRLLPEADHENFTPPEEIARVILFLASPDSLPINGAAIPVYGRS